MSLNACTESFLIPLLAVFELFPLPCAQYIVWVLQNCKHLVQQCKNDKDVFQERLGRSQEETRAAAAQSETLTTELADK